MEPIFQPPAREIQQGIHRISDNPQNSRVVSCEEAPATIGSPFPLPRENDSVIEPYDASSLLWTDSEILFQNLFSQDYGVWDQMFAGTAQPTGVSQYGQETRHDTLPQEDFAAGQGSHQAIKFANSLISNSVSPSNRSFQSQSINLSEPY
ncbi:C2H2 type zinc finger domain protein [Penicillium lagena]|uniref:C2H2 type zinc finger domain protein n=1 Tax=Penicillium lagena TaxID=94218 RepID=UPI0025414A63|nr:C2H2 type zinc finger domain protein [Penicillium lagena]KAJ5611115.1 C2H2 type zinc finger domain protein [Penicillium lagena]